jgi:CBS domain-containing protein
MARGVQTVRPEDDMALARQMMIWGGYRHLPVMRGQTLVGIVSDRDIAARVAETPAGVHVTIEEIMTAHPHTTEPEESVAAAAKRMAEARIDCLPVLEDGRLIGILTSTDVLTNDGRRMPVAHRSPSVTATAVMSAPAITARPHDLLRWALLAMIDNDVRHLPVVDDDGRLCGMLSDRDVRTALGDPLGASARRPTPGLEEKKVASAMTTDPIALRLDAGLAEMAACLLNRKVGAAPVVDEDRRVVGIVSYVDLLRHMMFSWM